MKALTTILVLTLAVFAFASQTYTGTLTYPSGIEATGSWANQATYFTWTVSQQTYMGNTYWHYAYTFSAFHKDISHLILQTSENFTDSEILGIQTSKGYEYNSPRWYKPTDPGNSNPNLQGNIFGIKFDLTEDSNVFTFSFYSPRNPMLGDFYAKDGVDNGKDNGKIDVTAWNAGFGQQYAISLHDAAQWGKIVVPDTAVIIPAPAAIILAGIGAAVVGVIRRRNIV